MLTPEAQAPLPGPLPAPVHHRVARRQEGGLGGVLRRVRVRQGPAALRGRPVDGTDGGRSEHRELAGPWIQLAQNQRPALPAPALAVSWVSLTDPDEVAVLIVNLFYGEVRLFGLQGDLQRAEASQL